MPTIEIASLCSNGLNLKQDDYEVAILEENRLQSHRKHFYDFLNEKDGTIVHIGNPEIKEDPKNIFFASEIIDWDFDPVEVVYLPIFGETEQIAGGGANQQMRFKFLNQFKSDIDRLLKTALDKSPIKKCYLLTDYYFGPEKENMEVIKTIRNFWNRHDMEGLVFNTMYEVCRN
jgi:hypothetical protein